MSSSNQQILVLSLCGLLAASGCALAKPYYYFLEAPASDAGAQQAVAKAAEKVGQTAEAPQIPHRIHGHLTELYSHGSSAVKSLADTVQPDIKNIGQDLNEVYQQTKENVGKRIEPIAQTVRPYIDHAQKVVAPYVNSAREEVPKFIHQAGPALSKVGGQMRDGITGVWDKLTSSNGQNPAGAIGAAAQDAGAQIQAGAQGIQQSVTNAIQPAAEKLPQVTAPAAA